MSISMTYKIAPLSISQFIEQYDVRTTPVKTIEAYNTYLLQNEHQHHYNDLTQFGWYAKEVANYLQTKEVA